MQEPVYKLLIFIKRREDLSVKEFQQYYEDHHRKLGEASAVQSTMFYYVRRYLVPVDGAELEYDVVTECWFKDKQIFDMLTASLGRGEVAPEVAEDEARFMDRSKTRFVTVVECESDLAG